MDFLVGGISGVAFPEGSADKQARGTVEAQVLAVRHPRGVRPQVDPADKPAEERRRRRSPTRNDPPGSRVLTLLVPDGSSIPPDITTASYRIVLRFIKEP